MRRPHTPHTPNVVGRRQGPVRAAGPWLLTVLLAACAVVAASAPARADDPDNYSLYQLASNAAAYFGNENAPADDSGGELDRRFGCDSATNTSNPDQDDCDWRRFTAWPASAGSLLGYADREFSLSYEWLASAVSGSSQSFGYDTLTARDQTGQTTPTYEGLLDYAHFGAANADLGLDSMSSGIGAGILNAVAGSIIWINYVAALGISALFWAVIQILKLLNPFRWFYDALRLINPDLADGMTQGTSEPGALSGLANWIAGWYQFLVDLSWQVLVPLFLVFFVLGLLLYKRMDRGAALRKLATRLVFLGVGLPLLGSMYTQILDTFDAAVTAERAGPTRVVLSTYVDFDAWVMTDRLHIPPGASISWDANEGHVLPESAVKVRGTALAINKQAHPGAFDNIPAAPTDSGAVDAWAQNSIDVDECAQGDAERACDTSPGSFLATLGILNRYITGDVVEASSFETAVKGNITQLRSVDDETKRAWFVGADGYGDAEEFGEDADPSPLEHPILAVGGTGLNSIDEGGRKYFRSAGVPGCRYAVLGRDGQPGDCNLSPLATYNYLNTGFGPDSMTLYSSNKAISGFTRENHNSVSQVGTGPAGFLYWVNAWVILQCIVLLGVWYAVGMLTSSIKRTFETIAAIPFATLGSIAAISKVIIYSIALVLEVLGTLFVYQFVSELLISLPTIIETPVAGALASDNLLASSELGSVFVVVATLLSIFITVGVTIAMLRVRRSVIQAVNEASTKLVNKFLGSDVPAPGTGGGGQLMPAVAGGLGAGAGMALAGNLMGGRSPRSPRPGGWPGPPGAQPTPSGGGNGLVPVGPGGGDVDSPPPSPGRPRPGQGGGSPDGGRGGHLEGSSGPGQLPGGRHGRMLALTGTAKADEDRQIAQQVTDNGGLTPPATTQPGSSGNAGTGVHGGSDSGQQPVELVQDGQDNWISPPANTPTTRNQAGEPSPASTGTGSWLTSPRQQTGAAPDPGLTPGTESGALPAAQADLPHSVDGRRQAATSGTRPAVPGPGSRAQPTGGTRQATSPVARSASTVGPSSRRASAAPRPGVAPVGGVAATTTSSPRPPHPQGSAPPGPASVSRPQPRKTLPVATRRSPAPQVLGTFHVSETGTVHLPGRADGDVGAGQQTAASAPAQPSAGPRTVPPARGPASPAQEPPTATERTGSAEQQRPPRGARRRHPRE